jgi:SNF2 family DNA or RNA helicase
MTPALYRHQLDALDMAIRNNGNACLFMAPGLGKTRTALEIYSRLRERNGGLKLLVVCPISLIRAAWGADIEKFTDFAWAPFRDMGDVPDIIIINYESLISKRIIPQIISLLNGHDFMCVLDESSRLKSNKAITTKTLLSIAHLFRHRIVLSGTPMPNSELELWGQARFVRPDVFDKSFYAFRNRFFHLERAGEVMAPLQGKMVSRAFMQEIMRKGWRYAITPFNREHLMYRLKPFTAWVKKEDALDLPEKITQIREVVLSQAEQAAYKTMRNQLVAEIQGQEVAAQVALAKVMKLRQATSGFMYDTNSNALVSGRTKLNELDDAVEQLGDQPVIVFAEFHYEIEAIRAMLAAKYGEDQVVTLYSKTQDRDASITAFQQGKARYLVAHPRSAAHGLTFVNCSTMVFFSLDYSYEAQVQAMDRIHRIGQKKACLYIYLVAKGTIDENLMLVLAKKQTLQDAVHSIMRGDHVRNTTQNVRPAVLSGQSPAGFGF